MSTMTDKTVVRATDDEVSCFENEGNGRRSERLGTFHHQVMGVALAYRSVLLLPYRGGVNLLQYLERRELGCLMLAAGKEITASLDVAISGAILPAFNNVTYGDDAAASDTSDTSLNVLKWVAKKGMNIRSFDIRLPADFEVASMDASQVSEDDDTDKAGARLLYLLQTLQGESAIDVARSYIRGNNIDVSGIVLSGCWLEEYLIIDNANGTPEFLDMILEEGRTKGLDVNRPFRNEKGKWNSLSFSACTETLECLKVLLDAGGAPNHAEDSAIFFHSDPLVCACRSNKFLSAKLLIERGANANISDDSGMTPLGYACLNKSERMVQLLIDDGHAKTNIIDQEGRSLLAYCAYSEQERIAVMLLEAGADPLVMAEADGVSCLHWCAYRGLNDLACRILRHPKKCDVNVSTCYGETPLYLACSRKRLEVAEMLFLAGADPLTCPPEIVGKNSGSRMKPLALLLTHGYDDLALTFITKPQARASDGADSLLLSDPSAHFAYAKHTRKETLLHVLASRGRDHHNTLTDQWGEECVVNDKPEHRTKAVFDALVERGADINAVNEYGESPLYSAAFEGNLPVIRLLINANAVTCNGPYGRSCVFGAVHGGHTSTLQALVEECDQDSNEQDERGNTPLHAAIDENANSMIIILIANDADVDELNHDGMSPLMDAIVGRRVPNPEAMEAMLVVSERKQDLLELNPLLLHRVLEADRHYPDTDTGEHRVGMMLILQKYCELRYDIRDGDGNTVVHKAIELRSIAMLALFLSDGADAFSPGGRYQITPLQLAVRLLNYDALEAIVEAHNHSILLNEADNAGNSLLHTLAMDDVSEQEGGAREMTAKYLLSMGLSVNDQNSAGNTPLYLASQSGNVALCTYLLFDASADPTIQSQDGTTAAMVASNEEVQNLLAIMPVQSRANGQALSISSSAAGMAYDDVWDGYQGNLD